MKKILIIMISLISIFGLISCNKDRDDSGKDVDSMFWNNFYNANKISKAYEIENDANYTKASFGYTLNDVQGHNNWFYLENDGTQYSELSYDSNNNVWVGNGTKLDNSKMIATGDNKVVRGYKVTKEGEATICGKIATLEGKNASFEIFKGENKIYPSVDKLLIDNDTTGYYFEIKENLQIDDMIYFVVSGEADCNPTIYYSDYEEVLYQVPEWSFYGDVHPYYYNGKMYMYNLQAYLEYGDDDARYMWCLHTSTDMFNYEEVDYEVYPFVENHYNPSLYVYESIFDKMTFPFGSRDMFLFFDHIANRYVYFGLCYYRDRTVCLGCRVSDDETGVKWSTPMFSIRDFAVACDPECSQALYINDRWYIITSIWGQSIHSVGRPAYLIGDKGKAFLDNDWSSKEFHYLDGEDLCAAQLVDVGDGHYLMYGWIPKTSYSNLEKVYFNGTRDHGLWGGNINVCREVYQMSDGTLATRLDSQVKTLLNRGKLYEASELSSGFKVPGTYNRTYVTFDVEMNNATEFIYQIESNDKTYDISLFKVDDKVYMSISCDQDNGHKIASMQEISTNLENKYEVQLIIDHSIVEFYVNNRYSLTARTSMFEGEHTVTLVSDNDATFKNFAINKLAHQGDVYD